jgi:DNA-binding CsgD family transcriptional regulator
MSGLATAVAAPRPDDDAGEDLGGRRRLDDHLGRLARLPAIYRRLRSASSVPELFAQSAALAREECGVARALVVSVDEGILGAGCSATLEDAASDRLRRRLLAAPIAIEPGTLEHDLVRPSRRRPHPGALRPSLLADALELDHFALGVIAPTGRPLALLLTDDPSGPLDDLDEATVGGLAAMVGMALEHVVMQTRLAEVSTELHHLTSSANALMNEVLHAPLSLPSNRGNGYSFARADVGTAGVDLRRGLSERDEQIARLLVEGRTNLEIATQLMLSPETVKTYVARLRRKLNAANRVEAASLYLKMVQRGEAVLS